jgi:hypothetical protein
MSFYLNFHSPTLDKDLKVKELTFKQYRVLNKFLLNNNNFHISEYFEEIVKECLIEKEYYEQLTNFDKFCMLYLLRCIFVSSEIELKENTSVTKIPLVPFLNKCLDFKTNFASEHTIDTLKLKITLPKALYFENILDAYYSSIDKVFVSDEEIDIFSNTSEERQKIIEQLPAEVTGFIDRFSKDKVTAFKDLVLKVGVKDTDKIEISPYNTTLFEILKALFSANLKNIYEMQYLLVSKMFFTCEAIDNNTLTENIVLCKIYEAELAKMQEEQSKAVANPMGVNK